LPTTLPRSRSRHTIHKEPHYYPIRNHLVDFLVSRSKLFNEDMPADYDPKNLPLVTPGLAEPVAAAAPVASSVEPARHADKAVVVNLRH